MASTPLWSFALVTSEWLTLTSGLTCMALIAFRWLSHRSSTETMSKGSMSAPRGNKGAMIEGRDRLLSELGARLAHARSYKESYSLFLLDIRDLRKHSVVTIEESLSSIASGGEMLGRMKDGLYLVGGARLSTWGTNDALTYICERLQQDVQGIELMTGMMRTSCADSTALEMYRAAYRDRAPFCSKKEGARTALVNRKGAPVSGIERASSHSIPMESN
jgi:hypothetical protein